MLSKLDKVIAENIKKEHTLQTFKNQILIDTDNLCNNCFDDEIDNICHIWQGQMHPGGYGAFTVYSKEFGKKFTVKAHRFAFAAFFGIDSLPDGIEGGKRKVLNHLCHNRACVNPYHLESITHAKNVSREKRKPKDGK